MNEKIKNFHNQTWLLLLFFKTPFLLASCIYAFSRVLYAPHFEFSCNLNIRQLNITHANDSKEKHSLSLYIIGSIYIKRRQRRMKFLLRALCHRVHDNSSHQVCPREFVMCPFTCLHIFGPLFRLDLFPDYHLKQQAGSSPTFIAQQRQPEFIASSIKLQDKGLMMKAALLWYKQKFYGASEERKKKAYFFANTWLASLLYAR